MPETPKRIQRKRTRGWKMPRNTVYVGRPTQWSNPFSTRCLGGRARSAAAAVEMFKRFTVPVLVRQDRFKELRGKTLCCWCKPGDPCHADILLEIANA